MRTIASLLTERAKARPDASAYVFLGETGDEVACLTYGQLLAGAGTVAGALACYGRQARIVLALPTSVDFCLAFYGSLLASCVAVPVAVPNAHRLAAVTNVVRDCEASCIIALAQQLSALREALDAAGMSNVDVVTSEGLADWSHAPFSRPVPEDLALLQYTSGSTSAPKGVQLTHANILANEAMINEAFGHSTSTTVVGWAPLHHDQGLIGNLIQPLYAGCQCVLMTPMTFLRAPHLWLQAISRYGAHTSGGPNFCFDLCVSRIQDAQCVGIDLSGWRVAFNGAEPIHALTLRRFADRFVRYGFRFESFFLCYGLAEASLFVSGGHATEGLRSEAPMQLPVGFPHRNIDVRLTAGANPALEPEICIAGPNVTHGYWGGRGADAFVEIDGRRYLRTGDTGFMRDGVLHVTGRAKEVMIVRGRNVYPYDIERTVAAAHPAFVPGACAVVALGGQHDQEIVAVQEVERSARYKLDFDAIAASIRRSVVLQHDVQVRRVLFAVPGFIPKTTSGKVRRAQLVSTLPTLPASHSKILATA